MCKNGQTKTREINYWKGHGDHKKRGLNETGGGEEQVTSETNKRSEILEWSHGENENTGKDLIKVKGDREGGRGGEKVRTT